MGSKHLNCTWPTDKKQCEFELIQMVTKEQLGIGPFEIHTFFRLASGHLHAQVARTRVATAPCMATSAKLQQPALNLPPEMLKQRKE